MAEQNPGGGGRGNDGAMAAQNPGGGGRGNDGAMAAHNPGGGGRGNDGAMAAQNGGGGRGNDGAVADQNPGGGGRGNKWAIPEFLPPDEALGGYIFLCDERTLPRITELMIFGYPVLFRNRVRAITPGLPLFLYNLSTHRLHGIYEAAGSGGFNIEPRFFPCIHDLRRSSFPAQVRVRWRTEYQPLNEQISGGIVVNLRTPQNNFYLYRIELRVPEAANIINVFAQHGVAPE